VLATASEARRQWLEDHAGELGEWVSLGQAMSRRADLLAVASEARPSRVVRAEIGPWPDDEHDREDWRRAAHALESYRDRWDVADNPDALGLSVQSDGIDPARRNDLVRAVATTRAVGRDPGLSRGPPARRSLPDLAVSDRLVATARPMNGPSTRQPNRRRRIAHFRRV
jgi:hypothetical protein